MLDSGILKNVAASTRTAEVKSVLIALGYRIRKSSWETLRISPALKKNAPINMATIAKITVEKLKPPVATIKPSVFAPEHKKSLTPRQ